MKFSSAVGIALIVALSAARNASAQDLGLVDFILIDGTGAPPRAVSAMWIRDGRIVAINETREEPEPIADVPTLDLDGAHVIPGLVEVHAHLANYPDPHERLVERLAWLVSGGVTTVRDLGGDARPLAEARRAIDAGEIIGPTLRISAMFGGETMDEFFIRSEASRGYETGTAPWLRMIGPGEDLDRVMAEARGAGADGAKLYGDLDAAEVRALGDAARRAGLSVWPHATVFPAGPSDLLDAGARTLSHAPYIVWQAVEPRPSDYGARTAGPYARISPDDPSILALLDRMAAEGVVLDTTLALYRDIARYRPPEGVEWAVEAFDWGVRLARIAHERGVLLAPGSDAIDPRDGGPPNTHAEMEVLVRDVGLSPMQAIVAGTRNGAIAAGVQTERGTLTVGMAADIVVLNQDPLADIANTRDIHMVIVNGKPVFP